MHIATTAEPASWIPTRLHPFAQDVGSIIPDCFAAYARVLHPLYRRISDGSDIPVRWQDIATANNRTIAAEMQRLDTFANPARFSPSGEELWTEGARHGSIPRDIAIRLAAILRSHTRTPESCWFAVWEGWGDLRIRHDGAPTLSLPDRPHSLLQGTINDVLMNLSIVDSRYRSPNLWWPDDRAWCVATEIDFTWSYIGGTSACVAQILADSDLEALPTTPAQGNHMEE